MIQRMAVAAAAVALAVSFGGATKAADMSMNMKAMAKIKVTSADVKSKGNMAEEQVAKVFGCSGKDVSPAISWSGAPADTKSFALTVYDPDAPTGSGFWHWQLYNIPAGTTSLPKNAGDPGANLAPAGAIQGKSDFGTPGYGGPCPPPGKPHRYVFTVYALKIDKLPVPDPAPSAAVVGFLIHANTIASGSLTGHYGR